MAQNGNGAENANLAQTHMSEEAMDFIREHAAMLAMAVQDHGIGKIQFVVGLSQGAKNSEWRMTIERLGNNRLIVH